MATYDLHANETYERRHLIDAVIRLVSQRAKRRWPDDFWSVGKIEHRDWRGRVNGRCRRYRTASGQRRSKISIQTAHAMREPWYIIAHELTHALGLGHGPEFRSMEPVLCEMVAQALLELTGETVTVTPPNGGYYTPYTKARAAQWAARAAAGSQ